MNVLDRWLTTADRPRWNAPGFRRPASAARTWGDGLADRSFSCHMTTCTWEDVADDELAFLLPALANQQDHAACSRLSATLRGAYIAHAFLTVLALSGEERIGFAVAFARLHKHGLATGLDVEEVLARGPQALTDFGLAAAQDPKRAIAGVPYLSTSACRVLVCLETALHDLAVADGAGCCAKAPQQPAARPTLLQALELSIYGGINGAYVYPAHGWAHELMLSAVWLGHLARSRPGYLLPTVAGCFADYLGERPGQAQSEPIEQCIEMLRFHADLTIGTRRLLGMAAKVSAAGYPLLVRPRPVSIRACWSGRIRLERLL